MKVFGIELSRSKKALVEKTTKVEDSITNTKALAVIPKIEDAIPEVKVVIPDTKAPALIPNVPSPVLRYHTQKSLGRGAFQPAEYDIAEVGRVEDTDSFPRQAFNKKVGLMFKEGWGIGGANLKTIKYIKARLAQISAATKTPTNTFLREIGSALVRKSNAFIIKVRNIQASGGRVRNEPGKNIDIKPVAGYFIAPAETMEFELSGNKISRWRQRMPNGDIKVHAARDVIHIFADRKEGFVFGTPILVPVMDDIRALRKIEENVEMLVYQHIFPLFQYKVGTKEMPSGLTESGEREIDVVRREIQFMPSEGGIVTPFRHEIIAIGAEGRALRVEAYLEHFKKRVFSGLGVSSVDMGEGHTSNRACYSEDTQTLTDSGFKYYWQITDEDKIATYNPETNEIEFQQPNGNILLYKHKGDMIHFKNMHIDVMVTPDHDMWVGESRKQINTNWKKIRAEDIDASRFNFITGGIDWDGLDPEDFLLPYVSSNVHSKANNLGPFPRIDIQHWLEFLGYYISQGTLSRNKNKHKIFITNNTALNLKRTDSIKSCLEELPFEFSEFTDPVTKITKFCIDCKSLYLYLEEECGMYSYNKRIPYEMLSYEGLFLNTIFETILTNNGYTETFPFLSVEGSFYSKSDSLVDQLQEIAIKIGYKSQVHYGDKYNRITISEGECASISQTQVHNVSYNGMVYCFNVPNHLFITRRNGHIGIHGNTADNMSRNMVDSVKDLQQIIEDAFNEFIIKELLVESTFGTSVLDEDNNVTLKFKEVDLESKTKKEAHAVDMYNKNAIDHDEMRRVLGREPLLLPTPEESQNEQDTPDKFKQWNRMFWTMFDRPKILMQSLDEPYSLLAQVAKKDSSISMGQSDIQTVANDKNKQQANLEKQRNQSKIDIAKAKSVPKKINDGLLVSNFKEIKEDVISRANQTGLLDHDWTAQLIRTGLEPTKRKLIADSMIAFKNGFAYVGGNIESAKFISTMSTARSEVRSRVEHYITKLANNIILSLQRNTNNNMDPTELSSKARAVFDSVEFRTGFIEDVEIRKAQSFGIVKGLFYRGIVKAYSIASSNSVPCAICTGRHNSVIQTDFPVLDLLPPHHAHCNCSVSIDQVTKEYIIKNDEELISEKTTIDPVNNNSEFKMKEHVEELREDAIIEERILNVEKDLRKKNS